MLGFFNDFFQKSPLEELKAPLKNPGRGFYQIYTFDIANEPDLDELKWSIDKNDSLALAFVELGAFINQDIPPKALDNLDRILSFFSENRMEIIFRAVYDTVGNAFSSEPSSFNLVISHYRDILGILMHHKDNILVYQGCLIGNWGEMHGSRFITRQNLRSLFKTYLEVTAGEIPLAVRQAVHWRIIHSPEAFGGKMGHTGIFDDAILAWPDHLGSFGTKPGSEVGWMEKWEMGEELTFISRIGDAIPFGGESVCCDNKLPSPEAAVERLEQLKTSYLNKIHHPAMIIDWKSQKLPDEGPFKGWKDTSLYDYIDARLGYRFVIENLKVSKTNTFGKPKGLRFDIVIKNTGFSRLYDDAILELNHGSPQTKCLAHEDLSLLLPGQSAVFSFETKALGGDYYLNLRRLKDGDVIRFSNIQAKTPTEPTNLSYFEKENYPGIYLGSFL